MFEQLFGSKTRVKLLSLFLNNPGRPYYVREITRKIDEQINSVRRELANLLSIGIIKSEQANNRLYYEVNESYEHYKELRHIFTRLTPSSSKVVKDTKEEDQIAKKLKTAGRIDMAFLTGRYVRQTGVGVDIFLVGDVNRTKLAKVIGDLEKEQGYELNYTAMTPEDYNYRLNLNDRFLNQILDARRITIIDSTQEPLEHKSISLDEGVTEVPVNLEVD